MDDLVQMLVDSQTIIRLLEKHDSIYHISRISPTMREMIQEYYPETYAMLAARPLVKKED